MQVKKIEHPELLPKLARQFPTMAALAAHLGVSRERVRQLLRRQGCVGFQYKDRGKRKGICPECGGHKTSTAQICWACYSRSHRVLVACDYCGKLKEIRVSELVANTKRCKHWYCSHSCFGKVAGKKYGRKRKYAYEFVWQMHLDTGYGAVRLGRLLDMPEYSVSLILRHQRATAATQAASRKLIGPVPLSDSELAIIRQIEKGKKA